jgi:hypothetical protein
LPVSAAATTNELCAVTAISVTFRVEI